MLNRKIILRGIPASPGKIRGKVRLVSFPEEIDGMSGKEIIVTSFLTPDFLVVVKRAHLILGIITDKGGLTCHAAIVARELKIPYAAGVSQATKRLKTNMIITLDGGRGVIYG